MLGRKSRLLLWSVVLLWQHSHLGGQSVISSFFFRPVSFFFFLEHQVFCDRIVVTPYNVNFTPTKFVVTLVKNDQKILNPTTNWRRVSCLFTCEEEHFVWVSNISINSTNKWWHTSNNFSPNSNNRANSARLHGPPWWFPPRNQSTRPNSRQRSYWMDWRLRPPLRRIPCCIFFFFCNLGYWGIHVVFYFNIKKNSNVVFKFIFTMCNLIFIVRIESCSQLS